MISITIEQINPKQRGGRGKERERERKGVSWVTLPLEPQKEMRNRDGGAASSVTSTRHRLQLRLRLPLRLRLLWRFRLRFCTKNVNRMSHWIDLQCRNKAILTHSGKSLDREISRISLSSLASRTCSPLGSPCTTGWERRRNEAAAHKWGVEMIISRAPRGAHSPSLALSLAPLDLLPHAPLRALLLHKIGTGSGARCGSDTGCGTQSIWPGKIVLIVLPCGLFL